MELLEMLNHPSREYSPVPFWFLNGDLSHAEIRRQLRDFCDHGVFGVVLHPRIGLPEEIGYLSEAFFEYLGTAVETAAELEMKVVLYDEGMYPSGSASGQVVQGHPGLASRGIALVEKPEAEDTVLCETEGRYLVERFSRGTIRGIHFGEDDGDPHAPLSADILNPEAVDRFILLTHEAYYRHFKVHFGSTIIGFFTDEPSILGRNVRDMFPWTKGFAEIFQAAGGNLSSLSALFRGEENSDTALYHRLILDREGSVYYARLSRWCEAHGIALMGHPHQSDDIEVQRWFGIPGQDLVFRMVAPEKGGITGMDSTMAKCSADMARLMGRRRNSNECFGACNREDNPWHFTGSDMKWMTDWLAVRGVNLFIPHVFYYSLEGDRSGERPPDVGPGSNWWPYYRQWTNYMSRLSCLMTEAEYQADIAVLCRNRELHADAVATLFEHQKAFEYVPESMWDQCEEKDGKLFLGKKVYSSVIGPADQFPSVSHTEDAVPADCLCDPPVPALRVAPLRFCGLPCWLLVNEGETEIRSNVTFPYSGELGTYDLWQGTAFRAETRTAESGRCLDLILLPRESLLVFVCDENTRLCSAKPPLPEVKVQFTLAYEEPDSIRKIYHACLEAQKGDIALCIDAEEMAELYVNDRFCRVSFWSPHRFEIPQAMTGGKTAALRLIVTGSLCNRYGTPVSYGLRETE